MVNGGGVIDKAVPAATDLLTAHPNINVLFGINNDSTLGIAQALRAEGKYNANWGIVASTDGSEASDGTLGKPKHPVESGAATRRMSSPSLL